MWQVQFLLVCCFRFSKQGLTMELGLAWNSALRKLWLKAQAPSRQLVLGLKALKAHTLSQRQLVLRLKVQASPRPTLALWLLTSNPISICRKHTETTKGAKEQKCHALWVSRGERKETEKELTLQAMTSYQELQQMCTHTHALWLCLCGMMNMENRDLQADTQRCLAYRKLQMNVLPQLPNHGKCL